MVQVDLVVLQRLASFLISQVYHVQPNARRQSYVPPGLPFVQNGRHDYLDWQISSIGLVLRGVVDGDLLGAMLSIPQCQIDSIICAHRMNRMNEPTSSPMAN